MSTIYYTHMDSPIGRLLLTGNDTAVTGLTMHDHADAAGTAPDDWEHDDGRFTDAREQLTAYFAGNLIEFELPLAPQGTEFQQSVWRALIDIPFGQTQSYGALAQRIGKPNASRAVGLANGRNPISLIVPCHRVIGADGSLTGYGGGIERKRWLLAHEQRVENSGLFAGLTAA